VLDVPLHPNLQLIIDATANDRLLLLTTKGGKPYTPNDFSEQFRAWCAPMPGLPADCHFHGLRYSATKALAEAGCTPHEIAAITGHATLAMVQKYTKGPERRRLARGGDGEADRERSGNKPVSNRRSLTVSDAKTVAPWRIFDFGKTIQGDRRTNHTIIVDFDRIGP